MDYIIYKITNLDDGRIYIGCTTKKLNTRISTHKSLSKIGKNKCKCKDFNWNNIEAEEVNIPDNIVKKKDTCERYFIENFDCVNYNKPGRTMKEWYQDNKEKFAQKYQDNKDKFAQRYQDNKEKYKEYYLKNKENICKRTKEYQEKNKEKLKEYRKEYYQNNKEKYKEYQRKYRENKNCT